MDRNAGTELKQILDVSRSDVAPDLDTAQPQNFAHLFQL